jgi:hypothetical protein
MNEFKKMQKLAGLITESEYQEAANIMDMAKSAHLDALKKELNSSDLDNWYITAASNANGIEITSTNQLQNFTTEHDDKGNVIDAYLYKIQRKPSSQKSLSITPAQKKEFLDISTFYMSAKFYNANTGQFTKLMTDNETDGQPKGPQANFPLGSNQYDFDNNVLFYYTVNLDYKNQTYQVVNSNGMRLGTTVPIKWYEYLNPPV